MIAERNHPPGHRAAGHSGADPEESARLEAEGLRRSLAALADFAAALQRGAADQADRERQVRARLLELHEQLLRRDREFHEAMRALTDRLREVTAHRDELEARLLRLRDSLPGRALRAARSLLSLGAR